MFEPEGRVRLDGRSLLLECFDLNIATGRRIELHQGIHRLLRRFQNVDFFQAEDGIRGYKVTGVRTCALPIWRSELMQLLIGMSTIRYLPPSGTAGFERS